MYHTFIKGDVKYLRSANYNYNFNLKTGYFERWGKFKDEDPEMSYFGPEILDLEISEQCHMGCQFCYKSNVGNKGRNMSFDTFVQILDTMPSTLTQIAFGIGSIDSNKDLYKMMEYSKQNSIIPNITINGDRMTDDDYHQLSTLAGAVSVSFYGNKDLCYNAIKNLSDYGLKQTNIHIMMSEETESWIWEVIEDSQTDERLKDLNAIVFLALKQKGRGVNHTRISEDSYKKIIKTCLEKNVRFGFDSCGANRFMEVTKDLGCEYLNVYAEPCESGIFSSYINVEGKYFPCSFAEDVTEGIDCTKIKDFYEEVWMNGHTCKERKKLLCNNRNCPYFEV